MDIAASTVDDCKKLTVWKLDSVSNGGDEGRVAECPRCVKGLDEVVEHEGCVDVVDGLKDGGWKMGRRPCPLGLSLELPYFFAGRCFRGRLGALVQVQVPMTGK